LERKLESKNFIVFSFIIPISTFGKYYTTFPIFRQQELFLFRQNQALLISLSGTSLLITSQEKPRGPGVTYFSAVAVKYVIIKWWLVNREGLGYTLNN